MKDLSFMVEENVKLNVRTTGIFTKDGKILVHKVNTHYALPGGRIQAREDSISALKREVAEEMNLKVKNTQCIGVMENFFTAPECKFHEYMWMIKGEFEDASVYEQEQIIGAEGEEKLVFEWVEIDKLKMIDFRPVAAIPYLSNFDNEVHHVISKEE